MPRRTRVSGAGFHEDPVRIGIRKLPRRSRRTTAANPAGLTTRELEIQKLIAGDLRNAEIAARRHTTVKTVDYHLSAILAKLGVPSRRDAGRVAVELTVGP